MDKIKVSDEALKNSVIVLEQLKDRATAISSTCIQQVDSQLSELDTDFRNDVVKYLEDIKILNKKLVECVEENIAAINERLEHLSEYETCTYKQRNFG